MYGIAVMPYASCLMSVVPVMWVLVVVRQGWAVGVSGCARRSSSGGGREASAAAFDKQVSSVQIRLESQYLAAEQQRQALCGETYRVNHTSTIVPGTRYLCTRYGFCTRALLFITSKGRRGHRLINLLA